MKTDCSTEQFLFQDLALREIVVQNDAETTSSDGGLLFLRSLEQKYGVIEELASHFFDGRNKAFIEHPLKALLCQRIFGLCQGYEDLNDHDSWRKDPLLAVACERDPAHEWCAGKSTLQRLEAGRSLFSGHDRYKRISWVEDGIRDLLMEAGLRTFKKAPREIILDFDTTDFILYGTQEGRFFSGYYDEFCYQPLYVFAGEVLLCAELLPADHDCTEVALRLLGRLYRKIRARWHKTRIIVRGDSGFCREKLMSFCEKNDDCYYVFGLPKNKRLERAISGPLYRVAKQHEADKQAHREYRDLRYCTRKSWSCTRRVAAKAEHLAKGPNPRFIVTNLTKDEWQAQALYEKLYCGRGNMENRIKEQKLDLFSDRVSCHEMRANQLRLWLSAFAYFFTIMLKQIGLRGTELGKARMSTIRLKLLKVAATVKISIRRILVRIPHSFPYWEYWRLLHQRLQLA